MYSDKFNNREPIRENPTDIWLEELSFPTLTVRFNGGTWSHL